MNNNELNNNAEQMPIPTPLDVVAPVEVPGTVSTVPTAPVETVGVQTPEPPKIKKRKGLLIIIILLVLVLVGVAVYFFVFKDNKKKEEKPETKEEEKKPEKEERPDWDPKTSVIKEKESDTKLVCTSETVPYSGIANVITYVYLYKDNSIVQVILEDEMIFSEEADKYYDYYVGSGLEEVDYLKAEYDNITAEVRQKKSSVSLAYAYDYTVDPNNPKNMLLDQGLDIVSMKIKLNGMGFECE